MLGIEASSMAARRSTKWASCPIRIEELGVSEGKALDVPEGLGAGVGKGASAGSASVSTTGDVSTRAAFFFFASSFKYSTSILQMSVQSCPINDVTRQIALAWHKIDSFWDGIIALLMKLNQYLAATLRSLFSMVAPTSSH
ncbi:hypothetical protein H5410_021253 [Solanum commersonii]|uniref:Uncharacterized protein n=1 Tax=Solanum commersonii TaxID=4109 RepID=A0A9J5ZEL3_SOLCO|nr:hypothetical protein H5410_021253 [Solanum commersonii]